MPGEPRPADGLRQQIIYAAPLPLALAARFLVVEPRAVSWICFDVDLRAEHAALQAQSWGVGRRPWDGPAGPEAAA